MGRSLRTTMGARVPRLIPRPTIVPARGSPPKQIEEYIGRITSGHGEVSIARMTSPAGWVEPGQTPQFREFTVVLRGMLRVEHASGVTEVRAGQAIITEPGEWVRYGSPESGGAEY